MSQMELDLSSRTDSTRPHHRTTTLTVNQQTFDAYQRADVGSTMRVCYCNDLVSSAKGGSSVFHHMIRRTELLRRQLDGGFHKVKIRTYEHVLPCEMVELGDIASDESFGYVLIRKVAA